ncbi:MAG: response regulator transcription factor, partial [Atopobiaceae bacterium]|nr:response regulator transcription factor [Atopobiaceae bacterium]
GRPDVLFMDISMPKTTGMQLAEALHRLKNPPAIVFVTAYSEYALEAFDVDAVDYLMKPVETDRLERALDKVQARLKPQTSAHTSVERIPVEKGGRKVLVPIDQIRYIEAKDDYSCIYTDNDRFLSTISLAQLENKLAPHGFFRVHRGYIVNLEYVEDVEVVSSGILQLGINGVEGKKISVSRRRVVQLKRALGI